MVLHALEGSRRITMARASRRLAAFGAVAVAALAGSACQRNERTLPMDQAIATADRGEMGPQAIGGGPRATDEAHAIVRNVVMLVAVPRSEATTYDGATAELPGVRVQSVASDRSFWMGPSKDQQILVVLSPEGAVSLRPGALVTVHGTVRRIGDHERAKSEFHLDAPNGKELDQQNLYVEAAHIDVVEP